MDRSSERAHHLRTCPRCGSPDLIRSHRRNPLERVAGLVILPWRCQDCYLRFFRPRWLRMIPPEDEFLESGQIGR